ncbi:hypothetical protein [Streptomyces sp. NPDC048521]|uniref:hypothetical protein n=1 Tax=Streptomyces sp. NPDC048521 TaxID=3365566 RepID=UPI003713F282
MTARAHRTSGEKTRRLAQPSAHQEDLRTVAYQLMDAVGLQRALLTGIVLNGEDLIDAGQVIRQSAWTAPGSRLVAVGDSPGPGASPERS